MNGKKAKRIRKRIYRDEYSHERKYFRDAKTGAISAEPRRRVYQTAKKVESGRAY
jgi:hypothetical protein